MAALDAPHSRLKVADGAINIAFAVDGSQMLIGAEKDVFTAYADHVWPLLHCPLERCGGMLRHPGNDPIQEVRHLRPPPHIHQAMRQMEPTGQ